MSKAVPKSKSYTQPEITEPVYHMLVAHHLTRTREAFEKPPQPELSEKAKKLQEFFEDNQFREHAKIKELVSILIGEDFKEQPDYRLVIDAIVKYEGFDGDTDEEFERFANVDRVVDSILYTSDERRLPVNPTLRASQPTDDEVHKFVAKRYNYKGIQS